MLSVIENIEQFHLLSNILPDPIIIHTNNIIVFANNEAIRLIGGKDNNDFIGKSIFDFIHPDSLSIIKTRLENLNLKKIETENNIEKFIILDGRVITAEVRRIPIIYDGKQSVFITGRDITEYETLTEQLQRKNQELKQALENADQSNLLKTAFLQNMSHEIRTPLNGILGFASILSYPDLTNEEIVEYSQMITKSGNRLLSLLSNIIDISKIESGIVELNNLTFSLNQLFTDVISNFELIAKEHNNEIIFEPFFNNEDDVIHTDYIKLNQILENLISNACKFTNNGIIKIRYQSTISSIIFEIYDNGIGIKESAKPYIFDRFFQSDTNLNRSHEGAGLGLFICKSLVEFMSGRIWFQSIEGKGSTFFVSLPLKKINSE